MTPIKNSSYKIYAFAVCFVTLMCGAITMGVVLYNLVTLSAPELTLDSHSYNAHQSIDAFRRSQFYGYGGPFPALMGGGPFIRRGVPLVNESDVSSDESSDISDADLDELRVKSYESVLLGHRRSAIQSIIRSSIIVLISLSLFFMHWRLIKRNNQVTG